MMIEEILIGFLVILGSFGYIYLITLSYYYKTRLKLLKELLITQKRAIETQNKAMEIQEGYIETLNKGIETQNRSIEKAKKFGARYGHLGQMKDNLN